MDMVDGMVVVLQGTVVAPALFEHEPYVLEQAVEVTTAHWYGPTVHAPPREPGRHWGAGRHGDCEAIASVAETDDTRGGGTTWHAQE